MRPRKFRQMEFRDLLVELIQLLQPSVYCEVGVKRGYTFNTIAPLVSLAIAVDVMPLDCIEKPLPGRKIKKYRMTSDDFAKKYKGPPIDFLFIDADHSRDQVIKDVLQIGRHVRDQTGLIFLHDTYPVVPELAVPGYCHNAWEAAEYFHKHGAEYGLEIVTLPGPWAGLSIMRKVEAGHLHWRSNEAA